MSTLVKDFDIKEHKSFDGYKNYFNMTSFKGKNLYRREDLYKDNNVDFIYSSITNEKDNYIIKGSRDSFFINSYEDPRIISANKFTYSLTYFDIKSTQILGTKMGYYDSTKKQPELYNLKRKDWEKNWQIHKKKIIYSIEPLEIYTYKYKRFKKLEENKKWNPWIKKYGMPRLSTNTFKLRNKTYTIFHSKIWKKINKEQSPFCGHRGKLRYFCGLMEVTKDYVPISYNINPIFKTFNNYNKEQRKEYVEWRSRTNQTWEVDIMFPQNVEETKDYLTIHGGINDCVAVSINLEKKHLLKNIHKRDFVSLI